MNTKIGTKNNRIIVGVGLVVILVTVVLKVLSYRVFAESYAISRVRSGMYLMLFALWGVSLWHRVIQKHTRFCLAAIAWMELLWIFFRAVKFDYVSSIDAMRYLWYLYYLPMLMIPALFLILAVSMDKPESVKPAKFLWLFPILSLFLFLLVLTNDAHQLVFIIPPGPDGIEAGHYRYGPGYAAAAAYIGLTVLAGYGIILVKCRVKNGRFIHFLPLIPLAVETGLGIRNIVAGAVVFGFYHLDISLILCLTVTYTLEACLQSGLILTNSGYEELFGLSSIRALITDEAYTPIISSKTYFEISPEDMKRAGQAPVMIDGGIRLSSAPIKGGHVLWQDDLAELDAVLKELSEINDYLSGKSAAVGQAYAYKKKERQIIEKSRLYNSMLAQTKPEIERYAELIEELDRADGPAEEKAAAVKIAFVSTFIKRRDNLIFLSEEEKPIAPSELYYCVEESLSALRLGGILCMCSYELKKPIAFAKAAGLYESFYKVLLSVIASVSSVCIYLVEQDDEAVLIMRICCAQEADLSSFAGGNILVEREEDEWAAVVR